MFHLTISAFRLTATHVQHTRVHVLTFHRSLTVLPSYPHHCCYNPSPYSIEHSSFPLPSLLSPPSSLHWQANARHHLSTFIHRFFFPFFLSFTYCRHLAFFVSATPHHPLLLLLLYILLLLIHPLIALNALFYSFCWALLFFIPIPCTSWLSSKMSSCSSGRESKPAADGKVSITHFLYPCNLRYLHLSLAPFVCLLFHTCPFLANFLLKLLLLFLTFSVFPFTIAAVFLPLTPTE